MKACTLSRCSSAGRRALPRRVAALGAWALLTAFVVAADFTWQFGPGVDVKKLAYEIRTAPDAAFSPGSTDDPAQRRAFTGGASSLPASSSPASMDAQVEEIVRRVLLELKK